MALAPYSGRIVLGQAWKRELAAYPLGLQFDWGVGSALLGNQWARARNIGNLVHVNRSGCLDQAKKLDEGAGDTAFVSFDSDATPRTPPAEALAIAQEDFDSGAGLVCAPVHNIIRNEETGAQHPLRLYNPTEPPRKGYFECSGSSLTWMFLAPLALKRLLPGKVWKPIQGQEIPLFCWTTDCTTEDFVLFDRVRELGMKTGCDGRLVCGHYKEIDVPGYGLLAEEV